MKKLFYLIISITVISGLIWIGGFVSYLLLVPEKRWPIPQSDAIIVLTGGAQRVESGLALMDAGVAPHMLISGMGEGITGADLATHYPAITGALAENKVTLGYEAQDTEGNVAETARWAKAHKAGSIVLVTAYYHQPRALMLFRESMPRTRIEPYPVYPDELADPTPDWLIAHAKLVVHEYHKFLVSWWARHIPVEQLPIDTPLATGKPV